MKHALVVHAREGGCKLLATDMERVEAMERRFGNDGRLSLWQRRIATGDTLHAGANEHDHLLKTGMPNGGRLQMWQAVGLSRQTQHADSAYGIQRHGIME